MQNERSMVPETSNSASPPDHGSPSDTSASASASASAGTSSRLPAFNCVVCKNRKVKCDRQMPCATCAKLNVECQYVEPGPRKKRKSSSKHENLVQRLNRYEELLKQVESNVKLLDGVDVPPPPASQSSGTKHSVLSMLKLGTELRSPGGVPEHETNSDLPDKKQSPERASKKAKLDRPYPEHEFSCIAKKGGLLSSTGRSRYYENNLWSSLNEELQELKESILDSYDEEKGDEFLLHNHTSNPFIGPSTLFGPTHTKTDLSAFYPSSAHCVILWNCFLENVNPLTLIVHYPSFGEKVMEYKDKPHTMPRNMEALTFSIYALTIASLENRQCQALFGETRDELLVKYRYASQVGLKNAGTLKTTDIVVLQAFVFFLLDLRSYYDYPSLWVITGMAVRIAQRMGIHRDGTKLNLPPFETEMRRRLWREILILDFRTAELSGAGLYTMAIDENAWDSRWPSSINEIDIFPGMTEPPKDREGPTENMWCQLRGELGNLFVERWRRMHRLNARMNMYDSSLNEDGARAEFANYYKACDTDDQLENISKTLEEKYIRHCDPINPLQLFTSIVCRSALANLRLMTHHPVRRPDGGAGMSPEEKDALFSNSIKIMEYDNLCHSTRSIQKYLWHTKSFFQWHAFIFLLGELRIRAQGSEVEKAWAQVDEVFEHHYEWLQKKDELHSAIIALALKAWECREGLLKQLGKLETTAIPIFVQTLRAMYTSSGVITASAASSKSRSTAAIHGQGLPNNFAHQPDFQFFVNRDLGLSNMVVPPPNTSGGGGGGGGAIGTAGTASSQGGPGLANLSPQTDIPESTASTSSTGLSNSAGVTPINWSEWESLLQNSDLLGFTGAFKNPYGTGFYNWNG
ncbi:hypothetical protein H072_2977 [Dactylellina haptotyla CBS 200.50]|uniref:Zn(2)-C6 fungal-type domain-containing protein n=1 Tax=Dactylellina haptotyla (strain CBS 200.50) TaxID=1284197 RepID=S8APJ6_DACHA|nr:hypothetical protein H072_2977 [Dactylellina haptotyla CBS 200.50]